MKKIRKNERSFFVHAFTGSLKERLIKAVASFYMSWYIDGFWNDLEKNRWEKDTFRIIDRFLDTHHSYIDIGAWYGPTVLYGSQIARHCYAVEPDPIAYRILLANIGLNPKLKNKITVYNGAIFSHTGLLKLTPRFSPGDSNSSAVIKNTAQSIPVPCLKFSDFIKTYRINDCNFIKIDTEGSEALILPTMSGYLMNHKPTLHISMHPRCFPDPDENSFNIINSIKQYQYIYSSNGKPISVSEVRHRLSGRKGFDVVLTDIKW
jgi:FkbM family methyltransferase